jgi:cell division protein FtsB
MMSLIKRFSLGCSLCLVAFICLGRVNALAQGLKPDESAQADHDQTLRQLLTEVRELRLALERATVANTRFQMLIERLKVQQTQVDLLDRQVANIHDQLLKLKGAETDTNGRIKELESQLGESSGEEHAAIEQALKETRRSLQSRVAEESQQLQAEAESTLRLQLEQSKLTDINSQLDLLLKELKGP